MNLPNNSDNCPCCSGRRFDACCGPCLSGAQPALTAEALMRSRYSAYVTHNIDYLEATLARDKRASFNRKETERWAKSSTWLGLEIVATENGKEADFTGMVEFIARFRDNDQDCLHREISRFIRKDGLWYYVDGARGSLPVHVEKTGRNDPCPCNSGKKFKKCCGA